MTLVWHSENILWENIFWRLLVMKFIPSCSQYRNINTMHLKHCLQIGHNVTELLCLSLQKKLLSRTSYWLLNNIWKTSIKYKTIRKYEFCTHTARADWQHELPNLFQLCLKMKKKSLSYLFLGTLSYV